MSLTVKLKHIDPRKSGALRFRRRFPKDCEEILGKAPMEVTLKNREGVKMQIEYEAVLREFDRLVDDARQRLRGADSRSPFAKWQDALLEAEGLLEGVTGLDEHEARGLIGDDLKKREADPLVVKALLNPKAEPPKATLQDAAQMYLNLKVKDNHQKKVRFTRTKERMEAVLGPLKELPLVDLRREHGRNVKDYLLGLKKFDGTPLAVESVRRDLTTIKAMVNLGITELDLEGRASNPFAKLELPKEVGRKIEKRPPLPDDVVKKTQSKLAGVKDNDALRWSWCLMAGTSAHVKEVAFLELQDIDIEREVLEVRPNSLRGDLKTDSRDRAIPLIGDALVAAKEIVRAMEGSKPSDPVFPRYCKHERSSDALSATLNNHIRSVTDLEDTTTYGLRHRVSAKLRLAGAPQETIDRVMGHTIAATGASTYGGVDDRLTVDREWMLEAGL